MRKVCVRLLVAVLPLFVGACASMPEHPAVSENAHFRTTPVTVPPYVITAHDQLAISIYKRSDFSPLLELNQVSILPDGRVPIPLIGDVMAVGLTPAAVRDEIATRLGTYLVTPIVNVSVTAPYKPKVYVLGEVATPGVFQLPPNTSAVEALALAGGVTSNGDLSRVLLFRSATTAGNASPKTAARVNLDDLLRKADLRQNVLLEGADVLYVPSSRMTRTNRIFTTAGLVVSPFAQVLSGITQILILTLVR